jgi:predicted cupin superfamily sugar epimerase
VGKRSKDQVVVLTQCYASFASIGKEGTLVPVVVGVAVIEFENPLHKENVLV